MKAKYVIPVLLALVTVLLGSNVLAAAAQDNTVTHITLNGDSIVVDGAGATANGSLVTITAAGTYEVSGTLNDGQLAVKTNDFEPVTLILNGVDIRNSTSAPINVMKAAAVEIILADGSQNYVSDAVTYVYENPEDDEPNAAVFSDDDMTISGYGSLTVDAHYNDGIASKDNLVIRDAIITVNAVDDGIRGKDSLLISGATLNLSAGGDGLKSDEDEDASLGYIHIASGTFTINAGGDAIQAETNVTIDGGSFSLITAGGSSANFSADLSAKGIKGLVNVTINGGNFTINAADDAVHSNDTIVINGGSFAIATGDDGMHADANLTINDGDIVVSTSYEGLESAIITINAGNISLVSSDDGLNVAGGADSSGMGGQPGRGARPNNFAALGNYFIYINGGSIIINAAGDGIDANGSIEMTGGTVIVNGPTENMNGALDYDGYFTLSGGLLVAAGSAGMAQAPDTSSTQSVLLLNLDTVQQAGTLVHIQAADGSNVLTFAPSKAYQSIVFASPALVTGMSYTVYLGGSSDGLAVDGLYQGGNYTSGTEYTSFTVSSNVTQFGGMGGMRGPGRR
ncbi:MAG: carbohydrate-binding domain-containing protein [Anaerolineaceae bacterium]|nr:carbohydrate-binding domain-containing protein [Anaerolineaceae bacterium]